MAYIYMQVVFTTDCHTPCSLEYLQAFLINLKNNFATSDTTITLNVTANNVSHSGSGRGTVPKNLPAYWINKICKMKVQPVITSIVLFLNKCLKMLSS